MSLALQIDMRHADKIEPAQTAAIHALCNRAYEEELAPLFATFRNATHLLGCVDGRLVSHAMWVTRWLQPGDAPHLRTAYVEMVATEPGFEGRGYATAIMQRLMEAVSDFDLAALCPADTTLYSRLGWIYWEGPLFIRTGDGLLPTPDERVMVWSLPDTPRLNLRAPLSAEWRPGELW